MAHWQIFLNVMKEPAAFKSFKGAPVGYYTLNKCGFYTLNECNWPMNALS